jgi:hypothetical protein
MDQRPDEKGKGGMITMAKMTLKAQAAAFVDGVAKCGGNPGSTYGRDAFVRVLGLCGGRDGNTVKNTRKWVAADRAWTKAVAEHTNAK